MMSVDYPVERFVVFNNNGRGEIDEELEALKRIRHNFIDEVIVSHMPANMGVAGAWNLMLKCFPELPYWVVVNDDVAFGKGLLEEMKQKADEEPDALIIHAHEGQFNVGSWDLFLLRNETVGKYGLFDENTYPAYNEDADYIMRFLNDKPQRVMSLSGDYMHGMGSKGGYFEHGGQTRRTDPSIVDKINQNNLLTMDYMTEKWGEGWRMCCPLERPYGKESLPLSFWCYDLDFVRKKHMGF